jgi:C-terminal processing protease CtpA/Prc
VSPKGETKTGLSRTSRSEGDPWAPGDARGNDIAPRSAHAETVLANMSNSKRSSGDAFDKHADELSAMLAESRRWLADVEAAEAEAGRGRVSSRPPSHVAEELYSPRLGLQQDETARDLAAVQEKKELEEAIVHAQQLVEMQKEEFKDGVQETVAAVLAKTVAAVMEGCGSSRMFECPRKFNQEPKYLSPGPMFSAVREPQARALDQGAETSGQEGCPARTLMEDKESKTLEDSSGAPMVTLKADIDALRAENAAVLRKLVDKDAEMAHCTAKLREMQDSSEASIGLLKADNDWFRAEKTCKTSVDFDLERAIQLTTLSKELVAKEHWIAHEHIQEHTDHTAAPIKNRTTVGIAFDDKTCVIANVLVGGPAFKSKRVFKGDKIVSIDSVPVVGGEIIPRLKGTDAPGSVVTIGLQRKDSKSVDEVKLRRMENTQIADKRQIFELFTKLIDKSHKNRDNDSETYATEALDLWTAEMLEEYEHDQRCLENLHKMQRETDAWLEELLHILICSEQGEIKRAAPPQIQRATAPPAAPLISKEDLEKLQKENEDLQKKLAENAALLRKLGHNDAEMAQCNDTLKAENAALLQKLEQMDAEMAKSNAECDTELREMLKQLGEAHYETNAAKTEVDRLKSELQALPNGRIGMKISADPPHQVLSVTELMDPTGKNMNTAVEIGDELCEIDGVHVETLPVENVLQRVAGPAGSLVRMGLQRNTTGERYDILVLRHLLPGSAPSQETPPRGNDVDLAKKLVEHEHKVAELSGELKKIMKEKDSAIALCNAAVRTTEECDKELREMQHFVDQLQQEARTAKEEAENLRRENQYLQVKICALTDATNSATLKTQESTSYLALAYDQMARMERELLNYRQREADARALVEQMNAQSGSESDSLGVDYRGLLPKSPIDNDTIRALERELLSDALKGSNTISSFSRHVHLHDDDSRRATSYAFVGDDDSVEI